MKAPDLEFAFRIKIELAERIRYGPTPAGVDRGFVAVLGGTVEGPRLSGRLVPHSGGDWPSIRSDQTVIFDARYLIEADDGALIELRNRGIRHGPKEVLDRLSRFAPVDPSEYYMRLTPVFEAPMGPHEWLTRTIFLGTADRHPDHSVFTYWAVL